MPDGGVPAATTVGALRRRVDSCPTDNAAKYELSRLLRLGWTRTRPASEWVTRPFSITNIELTNRCPMRCVMCPRTELMTRPQGYMSFDVFRSAVDELAAVNRDNQPGCILYLHHFGESLLHPQFAELARYASSLGLFTSVSINPLVLKPDVTDRLLDSDLGLLMVALDGHDDESFHAIRGLANAYELSKERLLRFLERKRTQPSNLRVTLTMIDFPLGAGSLAAMRDYWEAQAGVDEFYTKPFVSWNGASPKINHLSPHALAALPHRGPIVCTEPFDSLDVTWDGDVVACCFDYDKLVVLGNVREESLTSIWNGERLRHLRRELLLDRVQNPLCMNCAYLREPVDDHSVLHAGSSEMVTT